MTTHQQSPAGGGKTNLMLACEQGRTLEVKIILQKKPLAAASRDRNGKTALHYCAESGSLPCAQLVLSSNPGLLDLHDADGFTPLHMAVIAGNKTIARFFLKYGADPDKVDKERHSTVHWAAVCGDTESLDLLLNQSANPSTPDILGAYPIHYAAQMCGSNSLNGKDPRTGLDTLKKLVERGASIQCRDRDGREPLLWAASTGSSDAVLILFAAGANVASTDKDGLTALHCASSRGHTTCVETLVTMCGSRVDAGDAIGCSSLFYAAAQGHADSAQVLLKYGADPNLQDNKGRTPAHCAASKGQLEIMRIMDSNGADLWMRNSRGNLPLHEAVQSGRKDLVQWLLQQCGRAVNATNMSGRTPLHIAAQKNNVEMCEVLIDYGAHINPLMVNAKGFLMSPLDVSVYQGNQRCAKYLQLHGAVPATKVLENNEINRNLLFSLGNYAFNQNGRSDEEPNAIFDHPQPQPPAADEALSPIPRDAQTRTIRAGQQPPIPVPDPPPESLLTNVASGDVSDASVHIHLTRDDLWSLWESLMQELTSEMSEGSEVGKTPREVKQLKPILTNVYLRTSSRRTSTSSRDVIAGESILDKTGEGEEGPSRKRHSRSKKEDLKSTLPKVSEIESGPNHEWGERIKESSHINDMDIDKDNRNIDNNLSEHGDFSDSVGSDTEHRSVLAGVKVTRLRKRRSEGRSWGKEPEESETSSGHRPEQRGDNPYLKRYFQKQARAAEMRDYLSGVATEGRLEEEEGDSSSFSRRQLEVPRAEDEGHKQTVRQDYDDAYYRKQRRKSMYVDKGIENENERALHKDDDGHRRRHRRKSEFHVREGTFGNEYIKEEHLEEEEPSRSHRRRSKTFSKTDQDKMRFQDKKDHEDHRHRRKSKCDCLNSPNDSSVSPKRSPHHHTESYDEASPDRFPKERRRGSKKFLEVPSGRGNAAVENDDEDVSENASDKIHYHHHHHHHHHHHRPPLEKDVSLHDEEHHLSHHHRRHKRHFHRKRLRLRDESGSLDNSKEERNLSDGECHLYKRDPPYSDIEEQRSRSEMSSLARQDSKEYLLPSPLETRPKTLTDDEKDEVNGKGECVSDSKDKNTSNITEKEIVETKGNEHNLHLKVDSDMPTDISADRSRSENESSELLPMHKNIEDTSKSHGTNKIPEDFGEIKTQTHQNKLKQKPSISLTTKRPDKNQGDILKDNTPNKQDEISSKRKTSIKRQKSRTRSSKGKDKLSLEKPSVRRLSMGTKKVSPKREIKVSPSKPLKSAHSLSEILPPKTTEIEYPNGKSKSASARKDSLMPDIKVLSVEGNTTDLLIINEADSNGQSSKTLSVSTDIKTKDSDKTKEVDTNLIEEKSQQRERIQPVEIHKEVHQKHPCDDTKHEHENTKMKTDVTKSQTEDQNEISRLNVINDIDPRQSKQSSNADGQELKQPSSKQNIENIIDDPIEAHALPEGDIRSGSHEENIVISDVKDDIAESDIQRENLIQNQKMGHKDIKDGVQSSHDEKELVPSEKAEVPKIVKRSDYQKIKDKLNCDTPTIQAAQNIVEEVVSEAESIASQKSFGDKTEQGQEISFIRPSSSIEGDDDIKKAKEQKRTREKDIEHNDSHRVETIHSKNLNENIKGNVIKSEIEEQKKETGQKEEKFKYEMKETAENYISKEIPQKYVEQKLLDTDLSNDETKQTQHEEIHDNTKEPVKTENSDSIKAKLKSNFDDDTCKQNNQLHVQSTPPNLEEDIYETEDAKEILQEDTGILQDETSTNKSVKDKTIPQYIIPENTEHISADESTSEAETKFQSDESEDIQPEPDLTELFLVSEGNVQHSPIQQEIEHTQDKPTNDDAVSDVQHDEIIEPVFEAEEATNESVASNLNDLSMEGYSSVQENIKNTTENVTNKHIKEHTGHISKFRDGQQPNPSTISATDTLQIKIPQRRLSHHGGLKENTANEIVEDKRFRQNFLTEEKVHRDMGSQTTIVRGATEFYVQPDHTPRSISVQTGKETSSLGVPSKLYKKKSRSSSKHKTSQKTTAVQTEKPLDIQVDTENAKDIKLSVINEDKLNEKHEIQISDEGKYKKRKSKNVSDELTVPQNSNLSSPERHNPSAIFYKAVGRDSHSNKKDKDPKPQNRGALFYTTPAIREKETHKSNDNTKEESQENSSKIKQKPESRDSVRSRDRSLESEKQVAIANSAFRKLNANGELTVFNSSHINPSLDIERSATNSQFEMKTSCQRRGEYPSLEKPGFLWVHFGSGSSPIHTLKRKPNFTSQKMKRDSTKHMDTINEKNDAHSKRNSAVFANKSITRTSRINKNNVSKQDSKFTTPLKNEKTYLRKNSVNENSPSKVPTRVVQPKNIGRKKPEETKKINEAPNKGHMQQSSPSKDKISKIKNLKSNVTPRNTEKNNSLKESVPKTFEATRTIPKAHKTQKSEDNENVKMGSQEKTHRNQSKSPQKTKPKDSEDTNSTKDKGENRKSVINNESEKENKFNDANDDDDNNKKDDDESNQKDSDEINKNPRLSETAKSSSFEEGDVRLLIERKIDPGISIKIRMKDRHKSKDKYKSTDVTDISSAQGESDASYIKDSGYISTSESIHNHRRSITIDLGHTTAKINAGMKTSTCEHSNIKERAFLLPSVGDSDVNILEDGDKKSVQKRSQKSLPSKLPILEGHRQRSNSLVFMDYNRTPRRDSLTGSEASVDSDVLLNNSFNKRDSERRGSVFKNIQESEDKESHSSNIHRQTAQSVGRSRIPLRRSAIPIYKAHSEGNLHTVDKHSPRLKKQSLSTPSIHQAMIGTKSQSSYRTMCSIREMSSSSPSELRHSDTELNRSSANKLKLPSILLYEPDDKCSPPNAKDTSKFPKIRTTPRSKSRISSRSSSIFSPESGSLRLPLLQQPIRCRCSIQPHRLWDDRRSRSAVDCVANIHFLTEEELAEFDTRFFAGRSVSFSGGHSRKSSSTGTVGFRSLRTQALKRLNAGRKSADRSVTFHVDHQRERNTFKLPTEKLQKNRKWQVVFTIGKSDDQKKNKPDKS